MGSYLKYEIIFLFLIFINLIIIIYLFSIIQTILIRVSSSNWLLVWIIIELNLIIFIPFICSKKYLIDVSPSIKYFLAQVMGSLLLIIFIILASIKEYYTNLSEFNSLFLLVAIAIKSGTPPFHFWFPQLVEIRNWIQIIGLLILQKIIPLVFLFYSISYLFFLVIIVRGLIGSLGGFNQNSLKKIFAYSSIVHTGWIILVIPYRLKISLLYFLIYSFMVAVLIYLTKNTRINLSNLNDNRKNLIYIVSVCTCVFAISGIPPFRGFFIKLLVILLALKRLTYIILIMSFSLISIMYYLRIVYSFISFKLLFNKLKYDFFESPRSLIYYILAFNLASPIILLLSI